jgi:hypothetical protein
MQSASDEADFTSMLKEIQIRFQDTDGINPYEVVQELEHTMTILQKIKKGLQEESKKEYASGPKDNRMQQLSKIVVNSKATAEKLLGFSLNRGHFTNGNAYQLMPQGYVNRTTFEETVQHYQTHIASLEEPLKKYKEDLHALKSGDFKVRGCVSIDDVKKDIKMKIQSGEQQVQSARSKLLGYIMTHLPMHDATFSQKLAGHLDAMLEAYLELRKLQSVQ